MISEINSAFLGIGSNLSNRSANIKMALDILGRRNDIGIEKISRIYESEAAANGKPSDGPPYLNAAAEISTSLTPEDLLLVLVETELRLGRPHPRKKNDPRTIDLDILFYDDLVLDTRRLVIPHPELEKRLFVLIPLCDIEPALRHPVLGESISELEKKCRLLHPMTINEWKGD